jgi:LysR family transcriptional regulator, glycine cleavage system transcriptional activator
MRSLSRMRSLQAFEAAARHGSFTGAATELGISATAVGSLVRSLEDWVGRPVFRRARSGRERLFLTDDAKAALEEVGHGLDALEAGSKRLRGTGGRAAVVVTTSQSIAANWLIFRLAGFAERHPDIDVRLDVSDRLVDVAQGEADLGLRCGPGEWRGLRADKLIDEEVIAVVAAQSVPGETDSLASWFADRTLLHDATLNPGAGIPTWSEWFDRAGFPSTIDAHSVTINSTPAVVQAAASGQGVALVRRLLVTNDLAIGRLVELKPGFRWPICWAYYIVTRPEALRRREVAAFHSWLTQMSFQT